MWIFIFLGMLRTIFFWLWWPQDKDVGEQNHFCLCPVPAVGAMPGSRTENSGNQRQSNLDSGSGRDKNNIILGSGKSHHFSFTHPRYAKSVVLNHSNGLIHAYLNRIGFGKPTEVATHHMLLRNTILSSYLSMQDLVLRYWKKITFPFRSSWSIR